jgi:hypothetical protein
MSKWPRYQSHRIVHATPIVRIAPAAGGVGAALFVAPDGVEEPFIPTLEAMAARAKVGWYAVAYAGGYLWLSPKGEFEYSYRRKEE